MSIFSALNVASSGLNSSQRALEVISQNVANVSTPGYSRQVVRLATIGTTTDATLFSGKAPAFNGVEVTAVERIRDSFLEATRAAAGARQAALESELTALGNVQTTLQEPSDTSVQNALDTFFSSWQSLAHAGTESAASAAANVVIQNATNVTDQLNALASGIGDVWATTHGTLLSDMQEANQAASDLAAVNIRIVNAINAGQTPNDLMDKRDQLVRSLADLVGSTAVISEDGSAQVSVNGIGLVSGRSAQTITYSGPATVTGVDTSTAAGTPSLMIGPFTLSPTAGSASGALNALREGIPTVMDSVDTVAQRLITAVNTLYSAGYTQDGLTTGNPFFTGTDAASIATHSSVTGLSTMQVADASYAGTANTDFSVALAIGDLVDDDTASTLLGGLTGPTETWSNLVSALGAQIEGLQNASETQDAILTAADQAVESSAGVNVDEELTQLILYQRMYGASAKVISTIDEMSLTLLNMVGA